MVSEASALPTVLQCLALHTTSRGITDSAVAVAGALLAAAHEGGWASARESPRGRKVCTRSLNKLVYVVAVRDADDEGGMHTCMVRVVVLISSVCTAAILVHVRKYAALHRLLPLLLARKRHARGEDGTLTLLRTDAKN